jgi:tRNA(fMet)-specific endonuclease VapC
MTPGESLIILDTDVLSLVQRDDSTTGLRILARIAQLPPDQRVATTIVTYQEQSGGWLAAIGKSRTNIELVKAYAALEKHVNNYRRIRVLAFDDASADIFQSLRTQFRQMGTLDLRIASIALRHDALFITRNLQDFSRIPNLKIEDWTQPTP